MATQVTTIERKPRDTRQRVEAALREGILQGRIPPGSQLMQQSLAKELGASINLVREVLMSMVSQGLVASQPGVGFSVQELTVGNILKEHGIEPAPDRQQQWMK